jgi:hypothetical protein
MPTIVFFWSSECDLGSLIFARTQKRSSQFMYGFVFRDASIVNVWGWPESCLRKVGYAEPEEMINNINLYKLDLPWRFRRIVVYGLWGTSCLFIMVCYTRSFNPFEGSILSSNF